MSEFLKMIEKRRSIYGIANESPISDDELEAMIKAAVTHTPSAFNSQTGRVILLLGKESKKLWEIVLNTVRPLVPTDKFSTTEDKIAGFAAGYGTILFFEEQGTIKDLQNKFPLYADNFPIWSPQSSGMLQFAIWTALANVGLGASLQHYDPLIDQEVLRTWDLPESFKLYAQMPFGKIVAPASTEKTFLPIETRFKSFRS